MLETAIALTLGHVAADFLLQSNWIVANKRKFPALLLHAAIVGLASWVCLGFAPVPVLLLALVAAHAATDFVKCRIAGARLTPFLVDQAAHLVVILAVARLAPEAYSAGLWGTTAFATALPGLPDVLPAAMAIAAGLIVTVFAGGYAVRLLMAGIDIPNPEERLDMPKGGMLIGRLERFLIFLLALSGRIEAIGFLIAAKSVLRFNELSREKDRQVSEYVILGTLASFAWGLAASQATLAVLDLLAVSAPVPGP